MSSTELESHENSKTVKTGTEANFGASVTKWHNAMRTKVWSINLLPVAIMNV